MKQTVKKFFGIALCILLLLSLLPAQALAAQQDVGSILQEAYALDVGECLPYDVTLTGTIINIRTPYDTYYCNITVDIQIPGYELMPVQCYRLSGPGVESLLLGDTITVTGCLTNYNGTIEFMQGCTLDAVIPGGGVPAPEPPVDEQQIVDAAYELAPGETLPYVPTLTGTVVDIVSPYDENFRNITVLMVVGGKEDKPITCYRMRGEGVETLQVGDVITVHGTLQNYAKYDYETGELMYTTVEFYIPTLMDIQRDTQKVYCFTPVFWSRCYAYCWSNDGYTVGESWPGALMTEVDTDLWSMEVGAEADYIIFSNGGSDSGDLTEDIVMPVDDRNLYVVEEESWELLDYYYFYNPPVDEWGPDSLALVGDGLPGIPAWCPEAPEGDMKEVADNVYEKTLQVPAGTTMRFKIAGNDCWDDNWNFGCGEIVLNQLLELECGAGTLDMALFVERDCTVHFTVDLNPMRYDEKATLLVETDAPGNFRNLIVNVPDFWPEAYIYSFEPEMFGSWPGVAMSQVQPDRYEIMVPNDVSSMVISHESGDGGYYDTGVIQLADNGCDVIVTVFDDYSYQMEYIQSGNDWEIDDLYMGIVDIGGVRGWDPPELGTPFTEVSDNVFVKVLELPENVSMLFKPHGTNGRGEEVVFGGVVVPMGETIELNTNEGSPYLDLHVGHDCTVQFTIDLNPLSYGGNATFLAEEIEPPVTYRKLTVFAPDGLGDLYAYGWEPEEVALFPGIRMEQMGDHYETQIPNNMVNLMLYWEIGDDEWIGSDHMVLDTDGTDVVVTMDEYGNCTVMYVYSIVATYRVVGNAEWMGYWDAASDQGKMQQLSTHKYQKIFRNVQPGSYEFKITKDGKWDNAIGDEYGWNFGMYVDEVCDVSVTLTFLNGAPAVRIEYLDSLIGDVTGDGTLNLGDIAKLYAHICGSSILTDESVLYSADFTRDGKLNIGDTAGLYAYVRGTDKTSVVDAAYRLDENQELPLEYTLEGEVIEVVEPYNRMRDCITVCMIVAGRENYPILCTRLTGENAKDITSGDRITVTGRIHNFYGIVEFKEGCRLEKWEGMLNEQEQMWQWVDQAYALDINEAMDQTVTLEGKVFSVERPDNPNARYINVTILVEGREDKPIYCYRMVGSNVSLVGEGDLICVTGTLRNYNGTVEFAAGCQLDMGLLLA